MLLKKNQITQQVKINSKEGCLKKFDLVLNEILTNVVYQFTTFGSY